MADEAHILSMLAVNRVIARLVAFLDKVLPWDKLGWCDEHQETRPRQIGRRHLKSWSLVQVIHTMFVSVTAVSIIAASRAPSYSRRSVRPFLAGGPSELLGVATSIQMRGALNGTSAGGVVTICGHALLSESA
jgi:hypothetical protein